MSTLSVDTITGKSTSTNLTIGSTPVVSASANSLTIRGEGSNQTSIQQGLAKAWVSADGANDVLRDSFNVSSVNDGGTGIYEFPFTTNFASTNYSFVYCGGQSGAETTYQMSTADPTTSSHTVQLKNAAGSVTPRNYICGAFHGDLS